MNTRTRRGIAGSISVALVGGVLAGAALIGSNIASAEPVPTPTSTYDPAAFDDFRETVEEAIAESERIAAEAAAAEAARVEAERVAAEAAAAEAARVEAERVAAEQAAAEQAARDAAARQAPAPSQPQAPAAPAPAPPAPPAGDQQVGECREYNDANECTAWYAG